MKEKLKRFIEMIEETTIDCDDNLCDMMDGVINCGVSSCEMCPLWSAKTLRELIEYMKELNEGAE